MTLKFRSKLAGLACAGLTLTPLAPADAYLFWANPQLAGEPSKGDEPGIAIPLAGANAKEMQANLIWAMRAGLNVAALQCQFAPALHTVANYNNMLNQHAAELQGAYTALTAYFKRTGGKKWQTELDQYTTRTYNSFSTLQAQRIFCETAASIGRETLERPRGQLGQIAVARMREFRNSLIPVGDSAFAFRNSTIAVTTPADFTNQCLDRKGRVTKCKK